MSTAAILGSAFADHPGLEGLEPRTVQTRAGAAVVHRDPETGGWVLFRHGLPHRYLPHQVPWRAHALALQQLGVHALLVTSSVGLLDSEVPPFVPHLVGELLMVDNRLPDGSPCTVWPEPAPEQGHLVLQDGLFNGVLGDWLGQRCALPPDRLCFAYVPGPRTKTAGENRLVRSWGAQVNSMSLGPEVVLANELEIPTIAVVTGHKASREAGAEDRAAIAASLVRSREATLSLVRVFLAGAPAVPFGNTLYRFGAP
jgi:5'-methylthioadenosine phosphorylase